MSDELAGGYEPNGLESPADKVRRIRRELSGLEFLTRGSRHVRDFQTSQRSTEGPLIFAHFNGPGLLHLGLGLALAAHDAKQTVSIGKTGTAEIDGGPGLVEIEILDAPPIRPKPRSLGCLVFAIAWSALWLFILLLGAIGLWTIGRAAFQALARFF